MRRFFWTIGMALVGLFFGLKGQGFELNLGQIAIAMTWAGAIGFGLGSVFGQPRPRTQLVFYWAITLALVGLFFGPLLPVESFSVRQATGAMIGGLLGTAVGLVHKRQMLRKSQTLHAGDSAG